MKRSRTPSFDASDFLSKVGDGRTSLKFRKNQKIFAQDDAADSLYYVQKGRVKITVVSEDGKEAVVAIVDKDEFYGEGCLSGQLRRFATARAFTDCEITRIEKAHMVRTLREEPALSAFFLEHILRRAIRLENDLVDQLFNSSEKRLARALLMLAKFDQNGPREPAIPKISQVTLAEMIGTTRSRVSFFMNKFRKLGYISYDGTVTIHNSLLSAVLNERPPHIRADLERHPEQ